MHDNSLRMAQERDFHELLHSHSTVHWSLSLKIMPTLTCSHYFKNSIRSPSVGCFVLDNEMEKIHQYFINSLKKYEKKVLILSFLKNNELGGHWDYFDKTKQGRNSESTSIITVHLFHFEIQSEQWEAKYSLKFYNGNNQLKSLKSCANCFCNIFQLLYLSLINPRS